MLTEEVFDYIFLGKEFDFSKTKIPEKILKEMRNSFTYWYPVDLRCSGKDLIGNHLTMSLYNHAVVWDKNVDYMTKAYFCNGYILVDGEKMSKSKGNFLTVNDLIELYGADASRITLADCGDSLDDANFLREISNLSVNKLYSFENFVKILINEVWNKNKDFKIIPEKEQKLTNLFDKIFDNNINYLIKEAKKSYEEMKYKNVLKYAFYEMINIKDQYILYNLEDYSKLNPTLMIKYLKSFFIINNPIIPHFTEYMYITYLNPIFDKFDMKEEKIEFLCRAKYPDISNEIDMKLFDYNKYLNKVIQIIREVSAKKGRKKSNISEEDGKNKKIKVKILYSKEYNNNQKEVLNLLRLESYDENNKIILDEKHNPKYKSQILSNNNLDINTKKKMLEFAAFKIKEVESFELEALNENLKFNEEEILNVNKDLFIKLARLEDIEYDVYDETKKPKGCKDEAIPGKPLVIRL